MKKNYAKIIIAILLLLCLLHMPYGFYQLVRLVGMVGFIYLAYEANQNKKETEMFIFIGLAILFQPFLKIVLGRNLWNIIDIVIAVWLIYTAAKEKK